MPADAGIPEPETLDLRFRGDDRRVAISRGAASACSHVQNLSF